MASRSHPSRHDGGNLVSQIHQLSGRVFSRILKDNGLGEINPAQGRILYALWKRDGVSQGELSESTKLDKSTLTAMLDRLESAGQIERVPDPGDSRKKTVRTTERNRKLHERYEEASKRMIDLYYRGIPESKINAFEDTLRLILGNLEEELARRH